MKNSRGCASVTGASCPADGRLAARLSEESVRAVIILVGQLALTGAAIVSTADALKKNPDWGKKDSYTEKVTVRKWNGRMFLNPVKAAPACRGVVDGKTVICVHDFVNGAEPLAKSEITGTDGTVWVVTKMKKGRGLEMHFCMCEVEKKQC
jgi:hypothetical protein